MTRSKHYTGSDTVTTAPKKRRKLSLGFSRLSRQILLANMAGLLVMVIGVLVLDEMRQGLIDARIANLRAQGELIAGVLEETATVGAPSPKMDTDQARVVMNGLFLSDAAARVQLFDQFGEMITDSNILRDQVRVDPLSPIREGLSFRSKLARWLDNVGDTIGRLNPIGNSKRLPRRTRSEEVSTALLGETVAGERVDENGERVVSVSVPVQHVVAVLGVVTVESDDVEQIIAAERQALIPFIVVAVLVTLVSSLTLTFVIARPIRSLALAADRIRRGQVRRASIPDFSSRRDEIGDLSKSLESMTNALYDRLDAIESFAADVSHEIKNPLTSIRSAVEILPKAKNAAARKKLLQILNSDVSRLDRLISDISSSSRLDIDLARARAEPINLPLLIRDIVGMYEHNNLSKSVTVVFEQSHNAPEIIYGAEQPLARVLQNLIDNAVTFSPESGLVSVSLSTNKNNAIIEVQDQGAGVPKENMENIFGRFYTDRPKGQKFGTHSGLGLSIVRQIVTAHKGQVYVQNIVDDNGKIKGAKFIVEIPLNLGQ
ncbi:MAG: sensor N-terminal transmembrane domain-containing protein [Robiginitomaculum sp.]|nr:sensor N-terminal transmembrane domain-containing protein [Robiginitomaculum sp.]